MLKDAFLHNLPAYQTQFYIICLGGRGLQFNTAIGHGYVSRLNLIVHCLTSFNFYIVSEISSYTYVWLIVPAPLLPGSPIIVPYPPPAQGCPLPPITTCPAYCPLRPLPSQGPVWKHPTDKHGPAGSKACCKHCIIQCRQPVRAQLPPGRLTHSCCLAGNCHTHAYTQWWVTQMEKGRGTSAPPNTR